MVENNIRWTCYDSDKYEKRIITNTFDNTSGSNETGSRMVTPDGDSGVLVCHSDMGLTPMDLFNDILNNEDDLKEYLGKRNYKESEKISLRNIFMIVDQKLYRISDRIADGRVFSKILKV